jgi:Polyketide cyclase / dehydrase and lipid transport
MMKWFAFVAVLGASSPAAANVVSATPDGFEIRQQTHVAASPAAAYRTFLKVGSWWSAEHTYSGNARNLSIQARAGGCWCERLADGGVVQHMQVIQLRPGKQITFTGGLGPLQAMGASGAMTVSFEPDGAGTKVTLNYIVSGYSAQAFDKIAPAVDGVLAEQIARFAKTAAAP